MSRRGTHAGVNIVTSFFSVKRIPGSLSLSGCNLDSESDPHTIAAKALRQQEYLECLRFNLASDVVHKVVVLVEGQRAFELLQSEVLAERSMQPWRRPDCRQKLVPLLVHRQPTYAELFSAANKLSTARTLATEQPLWMVCNADIHVPQLACNLNFDTDRMHRLFDAFQKHRTSPEGYSRLVLALTRHESETAPGAAADAPLAADYRGSHDAFIFQAPLPASFLAAVAHPQNCYKSENIVIHALQHSAQALVLNPCLSGVKVIHRHAADVRQWLPPVDEERYARAPPMTLDDAELAVRG